MTAPHTRLRAALLLGCAVIAVAGCTDGGDLTSTPPSATAHSRPVPSPLNSAKFKADPCAAVTTDQLASIGFAQGTRKAGREGECYIEFSPTSGVSLLRSPDGTPDGLDVLYQRHARGFDTGNHWEERTVDGYPAVITAIEANTPSRQGLGPLSCTLALGIDDATTVTIRVGTYEQPAAGPWQYDPCGAAAKIAAFAVSSLRT